MAIHFRNTSPSMITLPFTSLNQAFYTQQSSPYVLNHNYCLEVKILLGWITEWNNNLKHHFTPLSSMETVFNPLNWRQNKIQSIGITGRLTHYLPARSTRKWRIAHGIWSNGTTKILSTTVISINRHLVSFNWLMLNDK